MLLFTGGSATGLSATGAQARIARTTRCANDLPMIAAAYTGDPRLPREMPLTALVKAAKNANEALQKYQSLTAE
ncbi:MAG TPA: hypothetical protein VNQ74_02920 [Burkholderiaceae bacterium]|nr:hypothetical protein [Burkholderiaceae bacterium]